MMFPSMFHYIIMTSLALIETVRFVIHSGMVWMVALVVSDLMLAFDLAICSPPLKVSTRGLFISDLLSV